MVPWLLGSPEGRTKLAAITSPAQISTAERIYKLAMATRANSRGSVSAFDEHAGLGEVTAEDGTVHPFHCTAIADGSRTVEVGTVVTYRVTAGRLGRWEASDMRPVDPSA